MNKGYKNLKNDALALAMPSIFALLSPFTLAVAYRNLRVWRTYIWASLIGNLGEPLLYLAAIGFGIGTLIGENGISGIPYDVFLAPGILVSTCMYTATFETTFGSFTRMKPQKTFDAILVTPVNIAELATGEVYSAATKSGLGAVIVLIVISAFGLVKSPLAILTIPLGFLVGYAFGALGLAFTAIAPDYSFFNYYFTLLMAPMFLLSGIFFPVSVLPEWARTIAQTLPLTHAVNISRSLCLGSLSPYLLVHVFVLFLGGLVSTYLSSILLSKRLIP